MSEGIRLQIFRFFGGWVWGEGKKQRQARADCVRPSQDLFFFLFYLRLSVRRSPEIQVSRPRRTDRHGFYLFLFFFFFAQTAVDAVPEILGYGF